MTLTNTVSRFTWQLEDATDKAIPLAQEENRTYAIYSCGSGHIAHYIACADIAEVYGPHHDTLIIHRTVYPDGTVEAMNGTFPREQ